jgi:hypothetical protein
MDVFTLLSLVRLRDEIPFDKPMEPSSELREFFVRHGLVSR